MLTYGCRKTQFADYVETPRLRKSRRKSHFPEDGADSGSSTTEASGLMEPPPEIPARGTRRKTPVNGKADGNEKTESNGAAESNGVAKPNGAAKSNGSVGFSGTMGANGKIGSIQESAPTEEKLDEQQREAIERANEGKDPKIDYNPHFDFGGPAGVTAMMIGFPLLMYYMWIGATYCDGKAPMPAADESMTDFVKRLGQLVYTGAFPSLKAWAIYWTFGIFEMACYCLLPGVTAYGKPLPHEGGRQLPYYCSAVWSFYATIAVAAALHFSGLFPLYTVIDEFGPIMSVAIISGYLVSIVAYFSAIYRGQQHRMTGYFLYDFFMGAELNPRMFGILDFKMFFEVRLPWYILFLLSCGAAARQYEQFGWVSGEVCFLIMAHFLYANACSKGEDLIVTTWYASYPTR